MPTENKVYVGDIGTILEAETKKDLSGVSVLRFEVTKPNGHYVELNIMVRRITGRRRLKSATPPLLSV